MFSLLVALVLPVNPADLFPIRIDGVLAHPCRLIVKLSDRSGLKSLQLPDVKVLWNLPEVGFAGIQTTTARLKAVKKKVEGLPGIERVDYDRCALPAYNPNDPMWSNQWHMRTINAELAWDISFGSPVTVAVLDTGVQVTHPDLANNIWTNPGEIPGNGIDDDHNGYIDDIHGYDFGYGDNDPNDNYGHGTACAGLVGAVQDNAIGVTGVAPHARIMAVKTSNDSGYFYDSMTIPAYVYAANNGARVFSMSYFADSVSPGEKVSMDYAVAHGVLPCAAAGNSNSAIPYYPGAYENVLSVAATDGSLNRAGFSNYGVWVDVAAPGVSLTTTSIGGYTTGFGGTSGATPHVAGLATLLFGAKPTATAAEVRAAIEDTATATIQFPYGEYCNYGQVNAQAAMTRLLGGGGTPRTPLVRYMTPAALDLRSEQDDAASVARIHGRGFQSPQVLSVTLNGLPVQIMGRDRDWIDVVLPTGRGTMQVRVNGNLVSSFDLPNSNYKVYPACDASTQGATLTGGFAEMLNADGLNLKCGRQGDGKIHVETVFNRVTDRNNMVLCFKRQYWNLLSGTERIYLYDWSSWSYPYASWIQVYESPALTTSMQSEISIPNPGRFVDVEGSVYCLIETETSDADGEVRIDMLRYEKR